MWVVMAEEGMDELLCDTIELGTVSGEYRKGW